jgi:hypothetical protein
MQVTELQVQRSLRALTDSEPEGTDGAAPPIPEQSAGPIHQAQDLPSHEQEATACPEGLVAQLMGSPAIRDDRLALARQRLEDGEQPSAEDLAQRMVGRLVCDRLR